jgi:hypothetical protein
MHSLFILLLLLSFTLFPSFCFYKYNFLTSKYTTLSHLPFFFQKIWFFIIPNLYRSPFLSRNLAFFCKANHSQLSLNFAAERLPGSGNFDGDGWGSCNNKGKDRTDIGVEGGV